MSGCVLVIDQGTTSTRAIVFGAGRRPVAAGAAGIPADLPAPRLDRARSRGPLAHDAGDGARGDRRGRASRAGAIAGVGIANQRETTLVWERKTGEPIHNAIVWQDRRTAARCAELRRRRACEPLGRGRAPACCSTPISPPTKIAWILDHVPGARGARRSAANWRSARSTRFLLWRLTDGAVHATDATNAARTSLFDIRARAMGRRAAGAVPRPARRAAGGARDRRRFRRRWRRAGSARRSPVRWRWPAISSRR